MSPSAAEAPLFFFGTLMDPEVLGLVPEGRPVSIEREVFPQLAGEGSVFGIALPGYWLDVGTPESYLQAHRDVLERTFETEVGKALGSDFTLVDPGAEVHPEARLVPPVYVGPGAVLEAHARVGSLAVVGAGSRVGAGAVVESGASIGDRTVLYPQVYVGHGAAIGSDCVLYPQVVVREKCVLGARVIPRVGRPRAPPAVRTAFSAATIDARGPVSKITVAAGPRPPEERA
mgnify:CR=1 FL=1